MILGTERGVGAGGISKSRRLAKCLASPGVDRPKLVRLVGEGVRALAVYEARSEIVWDFAGEGRASRRLGEELCLEVAIELNCSVKSMMRLVLVPSSRRESCCRRRGVGDGDGEASSYCLRRAVAGVERCARWGVPA